MPQLDLFNTVDPREQERIARQLQLRAQQAQAQNINQLRAFAAQAPSRSTASRSTADMFDPLRFDDVRKPRVGPELNRDDNLIGMLLKARGDQTQRQNMERRRAFLQPKNAGPQPMEAGQIGGLPKQNRPPAGMAPDDIRQHLMQQDLQRKYDQAAGPQPSIQPDEIEAFKNMLRGPPPAKADPLPEMNGRNPPLIQPRPVQGPVQNLPAMPLDNKPPPSPAPGMDIGQIVTELPNPQPSQSPRDVPNQLTGLSDKRLAAIRQAWFGDMRGTEPEPSLETMRETEQTAMPPTAQGLLEKIQDASAEQPASEQGNPEIPSWVPPGKKWPPVLQGLREPWPWPEEYFENAWPDGRPQTDEQKLVRQEYRDLRDAHTRETLGQSPYLNDPSTVHRPAGMKEGSSKAITYVNRELARRRAEEARPGEGRIRTLKGNVRGGVLLQPAGAARQRREAQGYYARNYRDPNSQLSLQARITSGEEQGEIEAQLRANEHAARLERAVNFGEQMPDAGFAAEDIVGAQRAGSNIPGQQGDRLFAKLQSTRDLTAQDLKRTRGGSELLQRIEGITDPYIGIQKTIGDETDPGRAFDAINDKDAKKALLDLEGGKKAISSALSGILQGNKPSGAVKQGPIQKMTLSARERRVDSGRGTEQDRAIVNAHRDAKNGDITPADAIRIIKQAEKEERRNTAKIRYQSGMSYLGN